MSKHAAIKAVPLAMLAVAWSVDLSGVTTATATADRQRPSIEAPVVPTTAFGVPASVRTAGLPAPAAELTATGGSSPITSGIAAGASSATAPQDIPAIALGAYQRAARVLYGVQKGCAVDWALLAAIGRVESDHGRFGGNTLDATGASTPGIIGIPLNGTNNTAAISDTDDGRLDGDTTWDRAVGPMQFIPSTWALVGVDGNGDGEQDPQNIYDATLASAVYLCAGGDDLGTGSGARAAVLRYNHSSEYADLVLSIASAYRNGDYSPVASSPASAYAPLATLDAVEVWHEAKRPDRGGAAVLQVAGQDRDRAGADGLSNGATTSLDDGPSQPSGPSGGNGATTDLDDGPSQPSGPSDGNGAELDTPAEEPSGEAATPDTGDQQSEPDPGAQPGDPRARTLTAAEAAAFCRGALAEHGREVADFVASCPATVTGLSARQAQREVARFLADLAKQPVDEADGDTSGEADGDTSGEVDESNDSPTGPKPPAQQEPPAEEPATEQEQTPAQQEPPAEEQPAQPEPPAEEPATEEQAPAQQEPPAGPNTEPPGEEPATEEQAPAQQGSPAGPNTEPPAEEPATEEQAPAQQGSPAGPNTEPTAEEPATEEQAPAQQEPPAGPKPDPKSEATPKPDPEPEAAPKPDPKPEPTPKPAPAPAVLTEDEAVVFCTEELAAVRVPPATFDACVEAAVGLTSEEAATAVAAVLGS